MQGSYIQWWHRHQNFGRKGARENLGGGAKGARENFGDKVTNACKACKLCHFYVEVNKFGLFFNTFLIVLGEARKFIWGGKLGHK